MCAILVLFSKFKYSYWAFDMINMALLLFMWHKILLYMFMGVSGGGGGGGFMWLALCSPPLIRLKVKHDKVKYDFVY